MSNDVSRLQEQRMKLEQELMRTERQIYELEGEYLQETLKDGNALRGWDGYLGKQASSGAIRRINRYREADRMFSFSSVTTGQAAYVTKAAAAQANAMSSGAAAGGGGKIKKVRKRARDDEG